MIAASAPALPARDGISKWARVILIALPVLLTMAMLPQAESPFSIPKRALLIAVSFGLFFFLAVTGGLRRLDGAAAFALIAIPAATLLAWSVSSRRDLGPQAVLTICAGPLLAWTAASLLDSRAALLKAVATSGVVEAAIGVAQWAFGLDFFAAIGRSPDLTGRMRVYGTMGNPDFLAIYVAATMPALLALARRAEGTARWLVWGGVVFDVIALGGAGSRTGIVAAMCGCAAVLLVDASARRARSLIIFGAIVSIAAIALAWRNPRSASTAARGRAFIWRVSLVDAAHRPFGDGPGTFAYAFPTRLGEFVRGHQPGDWQRFIGYERTANNDLVQAIADSGWPGAIALVVVFGFALIRLARATQTADLAAVAAFGIVIAIVAAAMTESPLQRAETWVLLWLCVGIATKTEHREPAPATSLTAGARATSSGSLLLRYAGATALTLLLAWFAAQPVFATYWADAGTAFESERKYSEAVDAYRRSLAFDPSASSAAFNLPRALTHAGDLDAAISAANDGLRWIDEPELRLLRLRILETRGSYVAAFQAAADDVRRFPYSPELQREYLDLASRLHSF